MKPKAIFFVTELAGCMVIGWYADTLTQAIGWSLVYLTVVALVVYYDKFNHPQ